MEKSKCRRCRASAKALKLYIAYAHIMCYTAREGFVMNEKILASPYRYENFTVRNDYAFKKVFGTEENKDVLTEFLSLITKLNKADFADLTIENTELPRKFFDDKAGRLDIKIKLKGGEKIDIEMQNLWFDYYPKRSIFYWTELYIENFKRGDDYLDLNKCIAINILNQPFTATDKVHSVYKILESEDHTPLSDILEIHFLDLTKLPENVGNDLEKWLMFIKTEEQEIRTMLSEQNTLLEKANQTMEDFYLVEEERKMYFAACKYESDRISMINASERKGIAKGIRAGVEKGSYQKALETARLMKCEKLDNALIAKVTGLSEAQVEQL